MRSYCTIVTASHLPCAWALAASLRASGNLEPVRVLVIDGSPPVPPDWAPCEPVRLEAVAADAPPLMRYYFSAFELCNALKPFLVSHLFEHLGCTEVVYLDSDLFVTARFDPVWETLARTSLILTPHHLEPPPLDSGYTSEVDVVDLGFMNGGFAAWRATTATRAMLAWMKSRFPVYGFYRHAGMAADQKLLPLLLAYFPDDVLLWRDPALNIAYWNAAERPVRPAAAPQGASPGWLIDGRPVLFFHLSGYQPARPEAPCAYLTDESNARILAAAPWFPAVLAAYRALLQRASAGHRADPYPFNTYDGARLNPAYRRLLFRAGRLDRRSSAYWRITIIVWLRMAKRLLTGVRPLR